MTATWDHSHHLCQSSYPAMLFLSDVGIISPYTSCSLLWLIWLLGWVPQAPTAPDFRMSPKHSSGKTTVGAGSSVPSAMPSWKCRSCHTCLWSTGRHWHLLQVHSAFHLGVFNLFVCSFILIMQDPCVWVSLRCQWWHCWCATAPISTD